MKTLGLLVGLFALVGATVHYANDQPVLLNFISNYAGTIDNGDDIYVDISASVTVHSSCPPDWSGTPAAGSDLDTTNDGGTLSGTTKSFDIG
ncbi:hypothetical protein TrVE_jg11437 [Triparma verrucosa]|uniref:Uncharacterized protein n=1 Tax=Triparma verrucosa TaxID=1606542 RepID=A0A9W7FBA8_9STRA|nr:hypothetical protein TrVE_jg11437 [Triparma verrucosa]